MTAEDGSNRDFTTFVRWTIAVLFLVCFTSGCGSSYRRSADVTESDLASRDLTGNPPGLWVGIFDGNTLDGWEQEEFNIRGAVQVKDESLQFKAGTSFSALLWTGKFPTEDYEFEVSAMRLSGNDIFCGILFPVGTDYVSMVLGGWNNSVVGLSCIDDLFANENETARGMSFDNNRWYHVALRVTEERIVAWIDDKQVIDQERKGHRISPYPGLEMFAPFGIFTYRTGAAMRDLRIRLID